MRPNKGRSGWAPASTVITLKPGARDWEFGTGITPKVVGMVGNGVAFLNYRADIPFTGKEGEATAPSANYGMFWQIPKGATPKKAFEKVKEYFAKSVPDVAEQAVGGHSPTHSVKKELVETITGLTATSLMKNLVKNAEPVVGFANRGAVEWKNEGGPNVRLEAFGSYWEWPVH